MVEYELLVYPLDDGKRRRAFEYLADDWERVRRMRQLRAARINRFKQRQKWACKWINLREIAGLCPQDGRSSVEQTDTSTCRIEG
jgi:hypothetical protein